MPPTPADAGGEARPGRAAIFVVRDHLGRVLLVRQRAGPFAGTWLLPGGGVEDGESMEAGVRREVQEETGLTVTEARQIARYDVRTGSERFDLAMFAGTAIGTVRPGDDEEAAKWLLVDPRDAHPMLVRELVDAGVIGADEGEVAARIEALGLRVTRVA